MFAWLKRRRRARALAQHALPDADWAAALAALPFTAHYPPATQAHWRALTTLFLVEKSIVSGARDGAHRFEVTPAMRILIAAQACLLILGRSAPAGDALDLYAGWEDVVVFPEDFPQSYEYEDEHGVVHRVDDVVAGESWEEGPVLLSWPSVAAGYEESGMALVIHEFAHKIDGLSGRTDGLLPIGGAAGVAHAEHMRAAYADFSARVERGEETWIDPYAAEEPEEFLAVCCEVFFAEPELLADEYPDCYADLRSFFRFDPVMGQLLG